MRSALTGSKRHPRTVSTNNFTTSAANTPVVDSLFNQWTITGTAQLAFNGVTLGSTSGVTTLAYVNGVVWQMNNTNNWYSMGVSAGAPVTLSGPQATTPIETITGITLSNASFTGGSVTGTVVGAITVQTTGPAFGGSLSLSGTDQLKFAISGSNLVTSGTVATGSYSINIIATQSTAVASPFTRSGVAITGSVASAITITEVRLDNLNFIGGSASGTTVGNITVQATGGVYSAGLAGLALSGTDVARFTITGASSPFQLKTAVAGLASGHYSITITATQAGATASPFAQAYGLAGNSSGSTNIGLLTETTLGSNYNIFLNTNSLAGSTLVNFSAVLDNIHFPNNTAMSWNYTGSWTGVAGYGALKFANAGIGQTNQSIPLPSLQLSAIQHMISVVGYTLGGATTTYDLVFDDWLTPVSGWSGGKGLEMMVFLHSPAIVNPWETGGTLVGFTTISGIDWRVSKPQAGTVVFSPNPIANVPSGTPLDFKAMLAYLVAQGVIASTAWLNGHQLGIEQSQAGAGNITIDSWYNTWS